MRALTLRQTSHNAQSGFSILWDGVHHNIVCISCRISLGGKATSNRKERKKEEEEDGCGASIGTVKFLPTAKLCGREKQQRRYYIKSINQSMFYFMSVYSKVILDTIFYCNIYTKYYNH